MSVLAGGIFHQARVQGRSMHWANQLEHVPGADAYGQIARPGGHEVPKGAKAPQSGTSQRCDRPSKRRQASACLQWRELAQITAECRDKLLCRMS
jgi:hypothetical protein